MANAFAHMELNTSDVKAAKKFYQHIFDWKAQDQPGGYVMLAIKQAAKDAAGAGMQKSPMPNVPSSWLPYVTVASVQKTLDKAAKAGAQVVLPFHDIGEMGAIGIFVDPTGATLGVWEPKARKPATKKAPRKKAARKTVRKAR